LLKDERRRFLERDWPQVAATIERLGLDPGELLAALSASKPAGNGGEK